MKISMNDCSQFNVRTVHINVVEMTNNKQALALPFLYFIYWLLHVSTVACRHQGASWILPSYFKCKSNGWCIIQSLVT
jgi:hypothetical protein